MIEIHEETILFGDSAWNLWAGLFLGENEAQGKLHQLYAQMMGWA